MIVGGIWHSSKLNALLCGMVMPAMTMPFHFMTLLDDEAKDSSRKDLEEGLEDASDRDFGKEMVSYSKLCICR